MNMNTKNRWLLGLNNLFFYVAFLVLLVALGYVSQRYAVQYDWTFGSRNSLTQPTQALLTRLDKPLSFTAFIPDSEKPVQDAITKLINKYKAVKPDTQLKFVNPDLNPALSKAEGVKYVGQVIIQLGDKKEIIESLSEQKITHTLQRLSRDKPRLVVFLEGHNERSPHQTESSGMSQLGQSLAPKGFVFQPHHLVRTQSLPDNTSFLVIASPQQDLLAGEVDVIVKYVKQGGNLLWLQEPGEMMGLQPLADALGITIKQGTVVDANKELHALLGIKHPAVVPVVDYGGAEFVQDLKAQSVFPFATAIVRNTEFDGDWAYQPFLSTLTTSWLETDEISGHIKFDEDKGDMAGPLNLGFALSRVIAGQDDKPDINQRIVVIGDSDFTLNAFVGHVGNLALSTAIFNWLATDDDLIAVSVTGAPDTKLDLAENTLFLIAGFFLGLLPLLLILAGFWQWWRRRKS